MLEDNLGAGAVGGARREEPLVRDWVARQSVEVQEE